MTVCVAALCGEGEDPRVVVAADHLVTSGGFMEFEHPGSKIVKLCDQALVMVAGNTNDGMRLVNEAAADMSDEEIVISDLAEDLGRRYAAARLRRAEQGVLVSRGLNFETFYKMHAQLNPQVVMLLDNALGEWALGVELLLAGVDDTGGHIHTNADPGGGNQDHGPIGWAAIGTGAVHVLQSMAGFGHGSDASYGQTLFRVYASKVRAEVAPGVGHETDVAVISREGIKRLTAKELEDLGKIYDNFVSTTDSELAKQLDAFDPEGDSNA
ncbi:MAG TPA: hypothetical protein VND98_06230 [Solirubrobacterales bacterium]|nr:hypothetical protein [Solirubrobacterales bacterium]